MIYEIFGLILGLILFLCSIKAYTLGFKHGKDVKDSKTPQLNINPVKTFREHLEVKEDKKKVDLAQEGWNGPNGILNYNPYDVEKE